MQRLPPRQRAVLLLRDVLGFAASEAARILGATEESVTSALKRARATLRQDDAASPPNRPPAPEAAREKQLIERLTRAYEAGDVDGIIALFTDDAWLTMPPAPLEYQGRDPIARFLTAIAFRDGRTYRLVPARANGQLAFGAYLHAPRPGDERANGLLVLTLSGDRIQAMTRFTSGVLPRFGLPPDLTGRPRRQREDRHRARDQGHRANGVRPGRVGEDQQPGPRHQGRDRERPGQPNPRDPAWAHRPAGPAAERRTSTGGPPRGRPVVRGHRGVQAARAAPASTARPATAPAPPRPQPRRRWSRSASTAPPRPRRRSGRAAAAAPGRRPSPR